MGEYEELLRHPRHVLQSHQPMSMHERAAQFSAFKALEGFEDEIAETGRLTDMQAAMSEDDIALLDERFQRLLSLAAERPAVAVTYFQRDAKKQGGSYVRYTGNFRFYDAERRMLIFADGFAIAAAQITAIEIQGAEACSDCHNQTE